MVWKKGVHSWNYGKHTPDDVKKKISDKLKLIATGRGKTKESEELRKRKISATMKVNGGGYRQGSGRGKKGWYKGFWCDSSWELAWIIYQLEHNVKFERNHKKFNYYYKGVERYWIPDFIVEDTYIEVKGYLTEQTISKIKDFKDKFHLITSKEIKEILNYVINKYGKDFVRLYTGRCSSG